jgi:hypothetical protein
MKTIKFTKKMVMIEKMLEITKELAIEESNKSFGITSAAAYSVGVYDGVLRAFNILKTGDMGGENLEYFDKIREK